MSMSNETRACEKNARVGKPLARRMRNAQRTRQKAEEREAMRSEQRAQTQAETESEKERDTVLVLTSNTIELYPTIFKNFNRNRWRLVLL